MYAKNVQVDVPNYYNIPIGAIVYFTDKVAEKIEIDFFLTETQLPPSNQFDSPPVKYIDTILYEGKHTLPELSGKLFWYGWGCIEIKI